MCLFILTGTDKSSVLLHFNRYGQILCAYLFLTGTDKSYVLIYF